MTAKERMLRAVHREKPDRMPVTIHQWQDYHLRKYMGSCDQLEAYRQVGLDASVTVSGMRTEPSADWVVEAQTFPPDERGAVETLYRIHTPKGELTFRRCQDTTTTFFTEYIAKTLDDAEVVLKYWPRPRLCQGEIQSWYDRTGDDGIIRGFVAHFGQPGVWQDFVELFGTQTAILLALDEPERVHSILKGLTEIKVAYVHEQMPGAKFDLIEHGGGAASSTVISPAMFREFCIPYDRQIIDALHQEGFPVVYHTCGGMMAILEDIPNNGCDASETLSPRGMGGDIDDDDQCEVKRVLGGKVGLIGGLDQFNVLTEKTPPQVREETLRLFATFGEGGGYICSASDHFFETPVENLVAFAKAGLECTY